MVEDSFAQKNLKGATANGIKVGVYFFSSAITVDEAKDEAMWVCNYISKYKISYPVAYDCEQYNKSDHRNYKLNYVQRTEIALAFLDTVQSYGYQGMFYNSSHALKCQWDTDKIESRYRIWKANYNDKETYYMWNFYMYQYTSSGKVPGINGYVDLDRAYINCKVGQNASLQEAAKPETSSTEAPQATQEPEVEPGDAGQTIENPIDEVSASQSNECKTN